MPTDCPSPDTLLLAALEADAPDAADGAVATHIARCGTCRPKVAGLREAALALRAVPPAAMAAGVCLGMDDIAHMLDGPDNETDRQRIAHLASCARCRFELTEAARLLHEPLVAAELDRLESPRRTRRRTARVAVAGGLAAAAALAGVLLGPPLVRQLGQGPAPDAGTYRERTITTTVAPRILGPRQPATSADSLRWTSVPGADLYRVTVWRRDGSVAWQGESRDTTLAVPADVVRSGEPSVFWDVKARTGWDRWVASDLEEIIFGTPGGARGDPNP